jgi:hypothetical protein
MTLYEFNALIFEEQYKAVINKATFLDNYVTTDIRMNLYAIDKFFVELVYDGEQNVVTEVRSFKSGSELEKYTNHINL